MTDEHGGKAAHMVGKMMDAVGGVIGKVSAAMTTSADGFVEAAAMSDMYELEAANIALKRSSSTPVREAAQLMIHDHSQLMRKLKDALHTPETEAVMAPSEHLDPRHQTMIDHLRAAPPEDFDVTYADQQVLAHEEAVTLMHHYRDHGHNERLRRLAAEASPVIEHHLEHMKRLREQLRGA